MRKLAVVIESIPPKKKKKHHHHHPKKKKGKKVKIPSICKLQIAFACDKRECTYHQYYIYLEFEPKN